MTDLNAPLTKDEATRVANWIWPLPVPIRVYYRDIRGKTPEQVALMLRMDGYTAVRDRDVLKAAGRL